MTVYLSDDDIDIPPSNVTEDERWMYRLEFGVTQDSSHEIVPMIPLTGFLNLAMSTKAMWLAQFSTSTLSTPTMT